MTAPRRSPVAGFRDKARLAGSSRGWRSRSTSARRCACDPLVAELFLTDNCNLKCVSCACWRTVPAAS